IPPPAAWIRRAQKPCSPCSASRCRRSPRPISISARPTPSGSSTRLTRECETDPMAGGTGGCACGGGHCQGGERPAFFLDFHCPRASGSAYAAVVVVPISALTIAGEPRYYSRIGDGGHGIDRGFCPRCGNPLFVKLERLPDSIGVHAASLDDPAMHRPSIDIF